MPGRRVAFEEEVCDGNGDRSSEERISSVEDADEGEGSGDRSCIPPAPGEVEPPLATRDTEPPPAIKRALLPPPLPFEGEQGTLRAPDSSRLSALVGSPISEPPPSTRRGRKEGTIPPPSIRFVSHGPFTSIVASDAPPSHVAPSGVELSIDDQPTLSDYLFQLLERLGVDTVFGLFGGAVAPLIAAVSKSRMRMVHTRHESGAVFAAIESYFVRGKPSVVVTTTGPGLTNALTGIAAARSDGAKVILISGATGAPRRGRWAFQETSAYTMPISGLFTAGPLFHHAATIDHPIELGESVRRIASGLQKPGGFVAHLSMPLTSQATSDFEPFSVGPVSMIPLRASNVTADECAQVLERDSFAIWVGFGARLAARQVRELARRTGAPVMCSPRGKGIFPESDPQFLGVTGFGGHQRVLDYMARQRPSWILVLGTRLGEFTSFWDPEMVPTKGFIHVDLDSEVPGAAYPDVNTIGIQADIGSFLDALVPSLPRSRDGEPGRGSPNPSGYPWALRREPSPEPEPRPAGPVRPDFLMAMIQRIVVERSDAPVITEAGNAFAWGTHSLRFDREDRYRVSTGFGSMGHAVTGVLGMAIARRDKAVALAGDGAMLMNNEISTAVQYRIPAVWIVLNDSAYGMVEQGMVTVGLEPIATEIPSTDFVMLARSMGADGVRVEREADVAAALERAMAAEGPFVVDIVIDATVKAPAARRSQSILASRSTSM